MDFGPIQFTRLARRYLSDGRTMEALVVCRKGLGAFPEQVELHLALADTHRTRGDSAAEASELAHVRRLAPEHPGLRERPPAPSAWRRFLGR